jgi:uncharacterized GH25 family protein
MPTNPTRASEVGTKAFALMALGLGAACVQAHDSWLSPARDPSSAGHAALELTTGSHYPLQEFSQSEASVAQSGCIDIEGKRLALHPVRERPHWLELDAQLPRAAVAVISCWVELRTAEVDIEPRIVQVYFRDIHAPASVRAAWSDLQAREVGWHERYRKFARIELAPSGEIAPQALAAARRPVGLDLEIVVLGGQPLRVGEPLRFQVLRGGRPLAGLPVELRSERSPVGVWRESDADGALEYRLPFGGRWLLRATDLRPSEEAPGTWSSRFVTLAIEAR